MQGRRSRGFEDLARQYAHLKNLRDMVPHHGLVLNEEGQRWVKAQAQAQAAQVQAQAQAQAATLAMQAQMSLSSHAQMMMQVQQPNFLASVTPGSSPSCVWPPAAAPLAFGTIASDKPTLSPEDISWLDDLTGELPTSADGQAAPMDTGLDRMTGSSSSSPGILRTFNNGSSSSSATIFPGR